MAKKKREVKPKKKSYFIAQVVVAVAIFVLFVLGILVFSTYDVIVLLIPLVIVNLVLGIINRTKGLRINIVLLSLIPLLPLFLVEYLASLAGVGFSLVNLIRMSLFFKKI